MTQPLGSHPHPMKPDADLTLAGLARIQGEVMAAMNLSDVVLVGNDSGAFLATAVSEIDRLAGLCVTTCEAFDRFPPGVPGRSLAIAARIPGAVSILVQTLRSAVLRRTPTSYGWMAKHGIPTKVTDEWISPLLSDSRIRADLVNYLKTSRVDEMVAATEALATFTKPALVVWTPEDKVMDPTHGQRIANLLPNSSYHEIANSYTLIPQDQPEDLARLIHDFVEAI